MLRYLMSALVFSVAANTFAADVVPCSEPEYHQFDFWLGNWDAFDGHGRLLGKAKIEKIEQGCVIQEWWRGNTAADGAGTSLSMYDRKHKLWRHVWASGRGNFAPIDGQLLQGRMLMTGYFINDQGQREFHRTIWEPVGDSVHHRWDASVDGGGTWNLIHEAWLRRTDGPAAR